jgi:O-antigen/teichoic acid export membrane protein
LLKNVGSNWTLNGLQILAFLVLARYILDALGLDLRGVWGALIALLGPLQLLVLGVPMASVRFMSGHVAKGDLAAANRVLATCFAVMLAMGAIALARLDDHVGAGLRRPDCLHRHGAAHGCWLRAHAAVLGVRCVPGLRRS